MKKILFFAIFLISAGFFAGEDAYAGAEHNVSGYAWSENIGWISFNSQNCDINGDRKSDGTPAGCPPAETAISNYGVKIDYDGLFSGYAWSENIGWINVAPESPYPASPNYLAQVDLATGYVSGWVRSCSVFQNGCNGALAPTEERGGWDGWIKLAGGSWGVKIDRKGGSFSGWAWSDSNVGIGWINFSGVNYRVTTNLVFNSAPIKPRTLEVNWNNCTFKELSVPTFNWTPYSDPDRDPQAGYEIALDNDSFTVPKFNHAANIASNAYTLNLSQDDDRDWIERLQWDTNYSWIVRVKDSTGLGSDWSNVGNLKTPKHAYPWVDFTFDYSSGGVVNFNSGTSKVFGTTGNNVPMTIKGYRWDITKGRGEFIDSDPFDQNPSIEFSDPYNRIKLKITDWDGYSCESTEKDIFIPLPPPEYREVSPTAPAGLLP